MLPLGTAGCESDADKELGEKLDKIDKDLSEVKAMLAKGAGPRAGARAERGPRDRAGKARGKDRPKRPPQPDAKLTYAVPIEGNFFQGPKNAKVTMVEAFEFA